MSGGDKKYNVRAVFGISVERLEEMNVVMRQKMGVHDCNIAVRGSVDDLLKLKNVFGDDINELSFMMFYTGYASGMANMLRMLSHIVSQGVGPTEGMALVDMGSQILEHQLLSVCGTGTDCDCPVCSKERGEKDIEDQPYHG